MKKLLILSLALALTLLNDCTDSGGKSKTSNYPRFDSDDNTIVQFTFPASKNPSLAGDAEGDISEDSISITVPHNADINTLVAEFVTNAEEIQVGEAAQQSGVTANNYSSPVTYTVTAANGDIKTYTVTVTKAPSTEKSIESFTLSGTAGTIDDPDNTIQVDLPPKTAVTSLTASFTTTGVSVTVDGTAQESGATAHDFSSPLVYRVAAEDGSTKDYTVTATVLPATWKDMTSFVFYKDLNSGITGDATGTISGTSITVTLPYGSSTDSLIASFETNGETVSVDETSQVSGTTANDFGETLVYRITAEDSSTRDYTVAVDIAKNNAKDITSFSLKGEAGTIDQSAGTITVDLAADSDVTNLTASFATTGVSVNVSGTVQESGVTQNDFTSPVQYTVTAEDETTQTYTVTAVKNEDITGLWNFEGGTDGSYDIYEATVTSGILGDALLFDGYDDYVVVPDSDNLTMANAGTVEVLVKINAYTPFAGIVHKGVEPDFSDEAFSLQFWGGGTVRIGLFNDSGDYDYVMSTFELEIDTWYYLAATWDDTDIKLFINGSLDNSTPNTIGAIRDTDGGLVIGAQLADEHYSSNWRNLCFNGIIDRVQLHGSALTEQQITDTYETLAAESGGALAAYLLTVAKTNLNIIFTILLITVMLLLFLYIRNKRHTEQG